MLNDNNKTPLVSIVLPVYNGEKFLAKSIESIINQTYTNWELIIIDDCSIDNSNAIAQKYAKLDKRIKIHKNENNIKLPASLNTGFKLATGDYYTWTSDDNEYYPCAIEKMVNFLQDNNGFGMVYAICDMVDENDKKFSFWGDGCPTAVALIESSVCGACFLYRKETAHKVGQYDEKTFLAEDHDYWLRMKLECDIGQIEDILYKYRVHKNSLNYKNASKARLLGINLSLKYSNKYFEKFPYLKKILGKKLEFQKALMNKDIAEYKMLKKNYSSNYKYQELKKFFILTNDLFYIKQIIKLGFKYYLKCIELLIKQARER